MTTALDTNVLVGLWDQDAAVNSIARAALERVFRAGNLVVAAPAFAELLGLPGRTEVFLDTYFRETGITVDWDLGEAVWRLAGLAFQDYVSRRRRQREPGPRRILADFIIGAHAIVRRYPLLTFDAQFYRSVFPNLHLLTG